jgi:hypothetical protein
LRRRMNIPKVTSDMTCDFAEHWRTKDGLFVAMTPEAINLATDWGNICMISVAEEIAKRIQAAQAKKAAAAAPKIVGG